MLGEKTLPNDTGSDYDGVTFVASHVSRVLRCEWPFCGSEKLLWYPDMEGFESIHCDSGVLYLLILVCRIVGKISSRLIMRPFSHSRSWMLMEGKCGLPAHTHCNLVWRLQLISES